LELKGRKQAREGRMSHWTIDDIPWDRFDSSKIEGEVVSVVKTAALVEHNSADYATYLCNVFPDDPDFQNAARSWAAEEEQHGEALARWAEAADPNFDFVASFQRFVSGYRIPVGATSSVRGSRSGELIARCVVECGTSLFYSALRDATGEPVLKAICHRIAGDEFRHYKLFYAHLQHYLPQERPWLIERLAVACSRFLEVGDDELAFAYHCANEPDRPYDRARAYEAHSRAAAAHYRQHHVQRATGMVLKASGVSPTGWVGQATMRIAWLHVQRQQRRALAA
jgi:rubrerythrin